MESHEADLRAEVGDPDRVARCQQDYRLAGLDARSVALLDLAVKLTRAPRDMEAADVDRLRDFDYSDADIVHAVQLISYFNYVNRVLDCLGVDPEPGRGESRAARNPSQEVPR